MESKHLNYNINKQKEVLTGLAENMFRSLTVGERPRSRPGRVIQTNRPEFRP